ncbi:MAG: hemolysin III family protein [Massilia sp.]
MYYGEKFNAISHLVGALLAVAGTVFLVLASAVDGDPWKIVSVSIYGASLILLYSFSTLYHSLQGRAKTILQAFDHQGIYLLIAGSYTPFCLVTLRGPWGWSLLAVVWTLALIGALQEWKQKSASRIVSLVIYIVMGWVAIAAVAPLIRGLGHTGFAWLAAGGVFYTVGIVFYVLDKRLKHGHGIWHLFVLAGSATHYNTILRYVL